MNSKKPDNISDDEIREKESVIDKILESKGHRRGGMDIWGEMFKSSILNDIMARALKYIFIFALVAIFVFVVFGIPKIRENLARQAYERLPPVGKVTQIVKTTLGDKNDSGQDRIISVQQFENGWTCYNLRVKLAESVGHIDEIDESIYLGNMYSIFMSAQAIELNLLFNLYDDRIIDTGSLEDALVMQVGISYQKRASINWYDFYSGDIPSIADIYTIKR